MFRINSFSGWFLPVVLLLFVAAACSSGPDSDSDVASDVSASDTTENDSGTLPSPDAEEDVAVEDTVEADSTQNDISANDEGEPCPNIACEAGTFPVDEDGDGCTDACVPGCDGKEHCDDLQYCDFGAACEGIGECVVMPQGCTMEYAPVCGCDGQTYGNACSAASSGVSVASLGECEGCTPVLCGPNEKPEDLDGDGCDETCSPTGLCGTIAGIPCEDGQFCNFGAGSCLQSDNAGHCVDIPESCPEVFAPVCGCDGKTHPNDCMRIKAKIQLDHEGPCDLPGATCENDDDCGPAAWCRPTMNGQTECTPYLPKGESCHNDAMSPIALPLWAEEKCAPGLDCVVLSSIPNEEDGICTEPCFANEECIETEFCAGPKPSQLMSPIVDICNQQGGCLPKPSLCPDLYLPVCGCDGNTYGNGCEAGAAGVRAKSTGECAIPGPVCVNDLDCEEGFWCRATQQNAEMGIEGGECYPYAGEGSNCSGFVPQWMLEKCDPDLTCVTMLLGVMDVGGICGHPCDSNDDCEPEGTYCQRPKPLGSLPPGLELNPCDSTGLCTDVPQICVDVWDPVCGCDGNTYGNGCEAAAESMGVAYPGSCESGGQSCGGFVGATCEEGQLCDLMEGVCSGADIPGTCVEVPESCPEIYDPVCGCDDLTYPNDCERQKVGMQKASSGACDAGGQPCGGIIGTTCSPNQFCDVLEGACGGADLPGTCVTVPDICPTIFAPVCGCDGNTYPNDCERQRNSVQKAHDGHCEEPPN